jgi:ribosomal protein S18 acetylase RimI-like enzyme
MIIRKAEFDDAPYIAQYMLLAMEEILYGFIGERDYNKAADFLLHFIKQVNNQYSYQNCWVVLDQDQIIGAVNIYDGAKLTALKEPVLNLLRVHYHTGILIEDETQAGEFYIDTIGVDINQQGKGTGTKLLEFLIDEYVNKHKQTLGLLVDVENLSAKKLYLKLGFKGCGYKTLLGKKLEHMQLAYQAP